MEKEPIVVDSWHSSKGDQYKLLCEYSKHVATLSGGSIVIITTLLDKMFTQPKSREAVLVAILCFFASVLFSVLTFFSATVMFPRPGKTASSETELTWMSTFLVLTCFAFVVGMGALTYFFWMNW